MALGGIVFDFDGLVIDTEWSVYQAIAAIYTEHGHELDIDWWRTIVGTVGGGDWSERLEVLVGSPLDHDELNRRSVESHHRFVENLVPLPGVAELVVEAHQAGLSLGVASSSRTNWLEIHLTRLGLRDRFGTLCGRDLVGDRAKPNPDVYLAALAALGLDAAEAIAIEDSPHGIAAATAAGLRCVAVPNRITAPGDFSSADLVVGSLAELTLADLQTHFG